MPPEPAAASADLQRLRIDRGPRAGAFQTRRSPWPLVAVVLLLLGGGAGGYWYWTVALAVPRVTTARAVVVAPNEGNAVLTASGYIVPQRRAILGAKSPRKITERFVGEGDRVEAGQVLARLDHVDVDARMLQAKAGVAASEALVERSIMAVSRAEQELAESKTRVIEARAKRDGDTRELARYREAEKAGAGVRKDRELAETALAVSEAGLASAEQRVKTAELTIEWLKKELEAARAELNVKKAEIQVAESAVEDTIIRAPFAGVILLKQAEVGEAVSPGVVSGQVTSGAIFQLADFDTLEAEVDVNEINVSRVREGQPAEIQVDAIPDRTLRGEVRLLMPGANRQKATVAAKITLIDKDPRLKPDMGCKVTFLREAAATRGAPKLLVPATAVRREGGSRVVYVVQNGIARRRDVEVGNVSGERIEIRSGLREGEEVLTSGGLEIRDGAPVKTTAP